MAKVFWEDKKSLVNRGARQILKIEIAPGIVCYENVMPSESFDTFVNDLEDGMRSAKISLFESNPRALASLMRLFLAVGLSTKSHKTLPSTSDMIFPQESKMSGVIL